MSATSFEQQLTNLLKKGATLQVFDQDWQSVQSFVPDWAIKVFSEADDTWTLAFRPTGIFFTNDGVVDWNRARHFEVDAIAQQEEELGIPMADRLYPPEGVLPAPLDGLRIFGRPGFGYHALVTPGTGDYDWAEWLATRKKYLESRPALLEAWESCES